MSRSRRRSFKPIHTRSSFRRGRRSGECVAEQHDEETPNEDEQAQAEKEEKALEDEL